MTKYVILEKEDMNWHELVRLEAPSATAATRKYVNEYFLGAGALALIAVPERSFFEYHYKVDTVRKVSRSSGAPQSATAPEEEEAA